MTTVEASEQPSSVSILEEIIAMQTLHLAPKHLGNLSSGVRECLSSMLLSWNEGLKAVPIVYTKADWNVGGSATILYDNPCVHVDVRVRWLALSPKIGARATGQVSSQGPDNLGLLLMDYFNVNIHASQLKAQYSWDEERKAWSSKEGIPLEAGQMVEFEIIGTSVEAGVLVIFGSVDKLHGPMAVQKVKKTKKDTKDKKRDQATSGWSVSKQEKRKPESSTESEVEPVEEDQKRKAKKHKKQH